MELLLVENEESQGLFDEEACVDCGICIEECPENAISEGS